jgi:hypothetical protein
MPLFKHRVDLLKALRRPTAPGYAPLCITCGRYLDSYSIVEGYPGESQVCKVLGKHHGSEELVSFSMGSREWDFEDLASMMRGHFWFSPTLVSK